MSPDPFRLLADEALLVRFATSRDGAALDELVRRRWGDAYRLAFRLLGDRALAEDVAQQAFVALIRGAGHFEPGRAFGPWFRTVVMNTARNASESRRTRRRHEDRVAPRREASSGAEEPLVAREVQERVTELPFELRSPLVLHFFEGSSLSEVAATLGCAKSTVQSRIDRGLDQLRGALAGAGCLLPAPELMQRLSAVAAANATFEAPQAPTAGALVALAAARSPWAALPKSALKLALAASVVAVAVLGLAALAGPDDERPAPVAPRPPVHAPPPPAPASEPSGEVAPREPAPPSEPAAKESATRVDPSPAPLAPVKAGEDESPIQLRVTFQATGAIPAQGVRAIVRGHVVEAETHAPLAGALVRLALPVQDMRHVRAGPIPGVTVLESRSDVGGRFELAIPDGATGSKASLDVMLPGYRSLSGSHMAGGAREEVAIEPGSTSEVAFELPRALFVAGLVVDEQERPVADVEVTATAQMKRGYGYVTVTRTDAEGRFEVYDYEKRAGGDRGQLELRHPGFKVATVQDVYRLADAERRAQRIVLVKGRSVSGHVLSSTGSAVAQVMVEMRFEDYRLRRAVHTDQEGRFRLEGLPADGRECTLLIHAKALGEKWRRRLVLDTDHVFEITLEPIRLRAEPEQVKLLGMTLVTVTEELKDAFDLNAAEGVMVLDPGEGHRRLGIGQLERGFRFWLVGETKVTTVEDLARAILDPSIELRFGVPVVYDFARVEFSGTNTQHMKLTDRDLEEVREFLERRSR